MSVERAVVRPFDEWVRDQARGTATTRCLGRSSTRPFVGADVYEVTARFRFRLRSGDLQVGYSLVRPDEIERDAFRQVVDTVTGAFTDEPLMLSAPAPPVVTIGRGGL